MKKRTVLLATALMTASLLTGCQSSGSKTTLLFKDTTVSGQITAINGNAVTVSLGGGISGDGSMARPDGEMENFDGEMPEGFDGELPEGFDGELPDNFDGEMPEGFDGELPDDFDGEMPEGFDGEMPEDFNGGLPGGGIGGGTISAELTIDDESIIEFADGQSSLSEVGVNSRISITFDSDGKITGVTIQSNSGASDSDSARAA